jgi:hypothetical protein
VCRPSTNLPALDHAAHHAQQWVTPELGLNSTGQGIPRLGKGNRKVAQVNRKDYLPGPAHTNNLQPLIPHMPVPPQEVCPFSAQQSFGCPTSLPGLQQQARHEFSEHYSCSWAPSGKSLPQQPLSPGESFLQA